MIPFSDLIVVVPGILGSRLVRNDSSGSHVVWDLSIRNLPQLLKALVSGSLELADDDETTADALFNYQLLPGFFGVDDYDSLVGFLRGLTSSHQVVTLPYDWRRSNRVAAEALAAKVGSGLNQLRKSGAADPKAWIVAHSMGGLVARYYCEQLGGDAQTRGIIYIGTPHRGSVNALDVLVNGKGFGPLKLTSALRTMPSLYELLPLFPVLRRGEGEGQALLRIAETFGLDPITGEEVPSLREGEAHPTLDPVPHLDRAMLQDALRFHAAIRIPAEKRDPANSAYVQRVIFNRRQHTMHSARVDRDRLDLFRGYPLMEGGTWREHDARGDGTVPAQSAVPIEWDNTSDGIPNAQKHAGIQGTREAHEAIRNWLWPADVRSFKGAKVSDDDVIVLDVPATLEEGDPLEVTLSAGTPTFATIEVIDASTGRQVRTQKVPVTEQPRTVTFDTVLVGVHKIQVSPSMPTHPAVSDYTYVSEKAGI